MAEWAVQPDRLDALAQRMEQCTRTLRDIQSGVDAVRGSLQFRLQGGVVLNRNLQTLCQQIEQEAEKNHQLSVVMQQAAWRYQSTEKKLTGEKTAIRWAKQVAGPAGAGGAKENADKAKVPEWMRNLFKFAGPIGDAAAIGADIYEGENGKAAGNVIKLLGKGVMAAKDGEGFAKWAENFFDTARKSKDVLTQKADIRNAKDFFLGKNAKPCAVAGTMVSWLGEGVCSWFGNAERINKADTDYMPHVITATLAETGVKIAEKAAVSWVVTSAVAAVCTVTGPAGFLVGGITAGATILIDMGMNKVAQAVTGDPTIKWTQAVGDGAYKLGKAVVKKGKETVKWVGTAARNVGNAVSSAWGSFCRWATG